MANDWQIGERIEDRWEIQKIFGGPGSSGMGIVYVVYDHETHEVFAAKTFQDRAVALDPVTISRFNREALAWVKLDHHQNVARAHAARMISGKPFLFLEYITGGDLAAWIGKASLLEDLPQVLRFALHFCDGMSHAFAKGIKVHRDIKPKNCLITDDRILKITDFGLAKAFDETPIANAFQSNTEDTGGDLLDEETVVRQPGQEHPDLAATVVDINSPITFTGMVMGTLPYMAPEQFEDVKHLDVRADIYSFGVMLFEMVRGERPFKAEGWQEYMARHQTQPSPPLQSGDAALDSVVATCLAKHPSERFQDFRAVRTDLARIFERLANGPAPEPMIGKELVAEEWYNKGLSLKNLGYSQAAIDCYDHALELKPNYPAAWNNKAVALDLNEAAIYCLDRALAINPGREEFWYNKGTALANLGRTDEAFYCFDQVIEINPLNDAAWNDRGAALARLGRVDEALESYDRALEIKPTEEKPWFNKANALRNSGRHQESLSFYDRALEINPRFTDALNYKGVTLKELGRYEEALECFNEIIVNDVQPVDALANKGKTLRELRRPAEAIECYDRVLRFVPEHADTWCDKGTALGDLGQSAEALLCFDRALKLNPRHDTAWYNKGNELRDIGRLDEAVAAYASARECAPGLYQASVNQGLTLAALGRLDESLACYETALKFTPNNAIIWFNRGNALFQLKRAEEALASYDRSLELDPRSAQAWNNKGAALALGLRNFRDAVECFEKAAELGDPNAPAAANECRRLLAEQGSHR